MVTFENNQIFSLNCEHFMCVCLLIEIKDHIQEPDLFSFLFLSFNFLS